MTEVREFRHTEFCMGTVFRFVGRTTLPEKTVDSILTEAMQILHEADSIFSLYKPDSPLSKLARGETSVSQCPDVVSQVWDECEAWSKITNGFFSAFTPQHTFDPSGLVKTRAADEAARFLESMGITDFAMNAGGDIRLSRNIETGFAKRIGLSKPVTIASEEAGVLTVVDLNDTQFHAVATSGSAERGLHIWNPKHGAEFQADVAQVTVVAQDLVTADVWATALFAAGDQAIALLDKHNLQEPAVKIEALIVGLTGELSSSQGFMELLKPV